MTLLYSYSFVKVNVENENILRKQCIIGIQTIVTACANNAINLIKDRSKLAMWP